jgi:hypothetical protein
MHKITVVSNALLCESTVFAMQLLKNAQLCNSTDKTTQLYAQSTPSVSEYVFFLL